MKKLKFLFLGLLIALSAYKSNAYGQTIKTIKTNVFVVTYSEVYQQPLKVSYTVMCPTGAEDRDNMTFKTYPGVITSDDADYLNNVWDKGHMAPAADFNCDVILLKGTFNYLNCALQHEGLNRGPWKELERFERDLAKIYPEVKVQIIIKFDEKKPGMWLNTGALVPIGFTKIISFHGQKLEFYFPNEDLTGQNWSHFKVAR
jgi:endonuclease G